jgi:ubiquinone/menaquinone biosynthesis C-methylase UbiE
MKNEISLKDIKNLKLIRESVKKIIEEASKQDRENLKVLDIAPQVHNGAKEFFLKSDIKTLDIDKKSNATYITDLCKDNSELIPSDYFDIIICTEVLEHTLNPFNAVAEIYRILKKGGKCYVTTPFNFRIHGPLPDCWRFTEHGLRSLFSKFCIIEINAIEDEERWLMPVHYQTIATK